MSKHREIRFRAWNTYQESMVYDPFMFQPANEIDKIEGDSRFDAPFTYYEDWRDCEDGVKHPCFIMQLTGAKDVKGNDIFEGDKVVQHGNSKMFGEVVFQECSFGYILRGPDCKDYNNGEFIRGLHQVRITGNIYV